MGLMGMGMGLGVNLGDFRSAAGSYASDRSLAVPNIHGGVPTRGHGN